MTGSLSRVVRGSTIALAAVFATGCYTMKMVPVSYVNIKRPPTVYIREMDGGVYIITGPSVSSDSLRGQDVSASEEFALPIREVSAMGIRQMDKAKTSALVSGGLILGAAVTYGVINAGLANDCERRARDPGQCAGSGNAKYGN